MIAAIATNKINHDHGTASDLLGMAVVGYVVRLGDRRRPTKHR
jgi:hypothetical protein